MSTAGCRISRITLKDSGFVVHIAPSPLDALLADRVAARRQFLSTAIRLVGGHANPMTGYAIVCWDDEGNNNVAYRGNVAVLATLIPEYVRARLTNHLCAVEADPRRDITDHDDGA